MSAALRCLFLVQGEGRGHMMQAVALADLLREAGHHVCRTIIGGGAGRAIPEFFRKAIGSDVESVDSPSFALAPEVRGIDWPRTLALNIGRIPTFARSLNRIESILVEDRPDVVISFFEPLAGLLYFLRRPKAPLVAIGHQYMFGHPAYPFAEGHAIERRTMQAFTEMSALRASARLALSFYDAADIPRKRLVVVPPLLRGALRQTTTADDRFILVYLLNRGYIEDIRRWHDAHPDTILHVFSDAKHTGDTHPNLHFHQLDGDRFLSMMARCRALVCTAGFESVSEAMYLGKPVMMVPVEGHYEQLCNALDAQAVGAGLHSPAIDLDRLSLLTDRYRTVSGFRKWVDGGYNLYVRQIERVAKDASVMA